MKVEFVPVEVRGYKPQVASDRSTQILNQIADLSSGFQQPMRSPVALDARPATPVDTAVATPSSSVATPIPAIQPPAATAPATPATAPSTGQATEPPQPANSTDASRSAEPSIAPSSPTETAVPAPGSSTSEGVRSTPFQKQKHSGFANPSDSFITSPNRTSLDSIHAAPNQPQDASPPADSMVPATEPAQPETPATPDHSALPPGKLLSAVPSASQSVRHQPVAASPASPANARSQNETKPPRSNGSKSRKLSKDHRVDWVASERVGAELIPDVSLLAAMAW